ncbi:MAG: hypothetical protein ACLRYM_06165 [Thomasclavelia ramosa]
MDLSQKINAYIDQIGGIYKTKKTYKDDIEEFMVFLCTYNKTIESQDIFKDYVKYLKNVKGRTENTIRRKKTVITRFYLFCYPNDDFDHFNDCIIYYDQKNNLVIKDYSQLKVVINKTVPKRGESNGM